MKKLIIIMLAGLFYLDGYCQEYHPLTQFDSLTGEHCYQERLSVDSVSKKDLYKRAKMFFAQNYQGGEEVINSMDYEVGYFKSRGVFKVRAKRFGMVSLHSYFYDFEIWVKDGAYKFKISNFIYKGFDGFGNYVEVPLNMEILESKNSETWMKGMQDSFFQNVYGLMFRLKKHMETPILNDW